MKILLVTPYLPGPPVFGGQRRIHGLLASLAASHEVSIISLVDEAVDPAEGVADAKRWCREVVIVPDARHRVSGVGKRLLQVRAMVSRRSWERLLYQRPSFQRALDEHLATHEYDVVNCEFVFMAAYRFGAGGARRPVLALDEHNVEYDVLRRTADATSFDRRVFNGVNWRKLKHEEVAAWKRFDGVTLTSARDERFVAEQAPRTPTAVVPNGVDVEMFRPRGDVQGVPRTVLFFGAINYFPNTDAVHHLVGEILPLLVSRCPGIRVRIVGPGASEQILSLGSAQLEIVGFVEDLRAEIERAHVVVAPLRIGGGTRLKILEAMSMAKPIVSTTIGAEGIDVEHGRDILLADGAVEFARTVSRVLDDADLAGRLGRAARHTAEQHYSWRAAAAKLGTFYEGLLERERRRR